MGTPWRAVRTADLEVKELLMKPHAENMIVEVYGTAAEVQRNDDISSEKSAWSDTDSHQMRNE